MKNKKTIDPITVFSNDVWSTDLPGSGINIPITDHWSISPTQWLADLKEQKIEMIRLKLNEVIRAINKY